LEQRIDKIVSLLIHKYTCKMIVFACNTATAVAIDGIRSRYSIPFIGMEPAVKPAALHSHTKAVGILATEGTLKGKLFLETAARFASDTHLVVRVGSGLVELVEAGLEDSKQTEILLREYLEPMLAANVDHIVLGCTHYPFLVNQIKKIVGPDIAILNPAPAVAKHTREVLEHADALNSGNNPQYVWLTSGEVVQFEHFYQLQMQKGELPALPLTIIHSFL
jgi:glutamate racemase